MNRLKRVGLFLIFAIVAIIAVTMCTACDIFLPEETDFSKDTLPEISVEDDSPVLKSETSVKSSLSASVVLITVGNEKASGLLIDGDGTFVTDKNILVSAQNVNEITATVGETDYNDVKIIKVDENADLAVLKINDYVGSGRSFSLTAAISDKTDAYLVGYDTDLNLIIEKVFIFKNGSHVIVVRDDQEKQFLKGAVLVNASSGSVYGVYTTTGGNMSTAGGSYKVSSIEEQKDLGEELDLTMSEYQRSKEPCTVIVYNGMNSYRPEFTNSNIKWGTTLGELVNDNYWKELPEFSNPGHILTGFSVNYDETEEPSETIRDAEWKIRSDVTLTAEWQEIKFSLGEGVSLDSSYYDKTYFFDALGLEVSVEAGYVWCGFYRDDNLLAGYTSDNPLRCNAAIKDASSTVTIEARTATLEFSANIDDMATLGIQKQYEENSYYKINERITLTASTTKDYDFLGWYDGETLQSQSLTYSFRVTDENKNYVAKWDVVRLTLESNLSETGEYYIIADATVSFDLNGASGTAPANQIGGGTLTYPDIPTRDGYVFAGWYDNSACTGAPFDFTAEYNENIVLYAKWIAHEGDGVWHVGNSYEDLYLYGQTSSDRKYYAFVPLVSETILFCSEENGCDTFGYLYNSEKSWLAENDDYNGRNFMITYEVTAGQLYYVSPAGYNNNEGTADIYLSGTAKPSAGGTLGQTKTTSVIVGVGDTITVVAETSSGCTWLGWYDGDDLISTDESYSYTIGDSDVTLTATWDGDFIKLISDTEDAGEQYFSTGVVMFNLNGASGTAPATQTGTLTYPDIPTRAGYVFAGWYDNSACTGAPFDFSVNHSGITTLYAKWIPYSADGVMIVGCTYENLYLYYRNSSDRKYYAFVPLVSEDITIYATSSWDTYVYLYNSNKGYLTEDDDGGTGKNFSLTYSVTAGQLYYVCPAGYSKSGNADIHLDGNMKPSAGGGFNEVHSTGKSIAEGGETVVVVATVNEGYSFLGWYDDNDTCVSSELVFEYTASSSVTFTAKYRLI